MLGEAARNGFETVGDESARYAVFENPDIPFMERPPSIPISLATISEANENTMLPLSPHYLTF